MILNLRGIKVEITEAMINRSDLLVALYKDKSCGPIDLDVDNKLFHTAIKPVLLGQYYFMVLVDIFKQTDDIKFTEEAYQLMQYFAFPKRGKLPKTSNMIYRMTNVYEIAKDECKKLGKWCTKAFSNKFGKIYFNNNLLVKALLGERFKPIHPIEFHTILIDNPIISSLEKLDDEYMIKFRKTIECYLGLTFNKLSITVEEGCFTEEEATDQSKVFKYTDIKGSERKHVRVFSAEAKMSENRTILSFTYKKQRFSIKIYNLSSDDDYNSDEYVQARWGLVNTRFGVAFADSSVNLFTREVTFHKWLRESQIRAFTELTENGFTVKF